MDALIRALGDPPDLDRLEDDLVYDAVERRLERICEAVSRLTRAGAELETLEPAIRWGDIRGFGNRLRHEYDQIAPDVVRSILSSHLSPLRTAALRLQVRFDPDQAGPRPMA